MELYSDLEQSSREEIPDNSKSNKCIIANCVHISDRYVPPRAVLALPEMLKFRHDNIFPRRSLPSRIRFGPIEGVRQLISKIKLKELIEKSLELKKPLFLLKADDDFVIHLDNTDHDKTNWLTLLSLGDQTTANVWLYEEGNELYAITTKSIPSREPLKLGYSSEYVLLHGFLPQSPCLDIHEVLSSPPTEWWCYECQRAMLSEALLKHHKDTEHKVDKANSRQQYKCQRCKRKFSRLFTLNRHMMMHCSKSKEKTTARPKSPAKPLANMEPEMNTNSLLEESRVPSEDVLHNFTSSLDFNNLFDTYRVSSLDLSGGSKSSLYINEPENQLCKDNNVLADLSDPFPSISSEVRDYSSNETSDKIEGTRSDLNEILPVCSTDIKTLDKKQEQVRDVPVDIFSCECGHIFSNKEKLIRHVMDPTNCKKTVETSDIMYKCEDCQLIFKRRGMFVNHLWRVHKNNTTSIPLERRVRYYPCGTCTKIYCTAAKRDRHVNKHHPGTARGAARAVESGRRACAAAACAACPRQYASRAKLLQHVRAAHPALVPVLKMDATADPKT